MHLRAVYAALFCSKCVVHSARVIILAAMVTLVVTEVVALGDSVYNCAYFSIGTILGLKTAHF